MPVGSAAVRALSGFGNGGLLNSSRPATPTPLLNHHQGLSSFTIGDGTSILDRKLGKIAADRQNALRQDLVTAAKIEEEVVMVRRPTSVTNEQVNVFLNGRADAITQQMQQEDQEVSSLFQYV